MALKTPIECGSDAKFGGVHFSGPPRLGPLGDFFLFFCVKFGAYYSTLGSPLWNQVRPHSIKKIGGRFYPTPSRILDSEPRSMGVFRHFLCDALKCWEIMELELFHTSIALIHPCWEPTRVGLKLIQFKCVILHQSGVLELTPIQITPWGCRFQQQLIGYHVAFFIIIDSKILKLLETSITMSKAFNFQMIMISFEIK